MRTSRPCLSFRGSKPILEVFLDADMAEDLDGRKFTFIFLFTFAKGATWNNDLDTRNSTFGYVLLMAKGATSWKSKKQTPIPHLQKLNL